MSGRLLNWPAWPEFSAEHGETDESLIQYKRDIVEEYGKDNIVRAWVKVCAELEKITVDIAARGTSAIPEVDFKDIFTLSDSERQKLKDTGCFVIRGVYDRAQADRWFQDLKSYVAANKDEVKGK